MVVSQEDFIRFFEAMKNGTYKCPFCGHERFGVNLVAAIPSSPRPESPTAVLSLQASIDPDGLPLGPHQFYSFSCLNCGRSDFFHRNQVWAWLARNRSGV
jgi:predicted nucleic-acid-binding Zn-ribbon protein